MGGTVLTVLALMKSEPSETVTGTKHNIALAMQTVASRLGNTPTICRKCYVHPAILELYSSGSLVDAVERRIRQAKRKRQPHLQPEEAAVLALLVELESSSSQSHLASPP